MTEQVLYAGITICSFCRSRYRVRASNSSLEGKKARCSRCHQDFEIRIIKPSPVEQTAITSAASDTQKKRKRTRAEIKEEHLQRVSESLNTYHKRLRAIHDAEKSSEEEIRRWCVDVIRDALGYEDHEIDTEMRALNKRIDIAIKSGNRVRLIIECKNIRFKLTEAARNQAIGYAASKSADWAVLTNGQVWQLYHVRPRKGRDPEAFQVFDIGLLDEDGVSVDDVEKLYLLSKRALDTKDIDKAHHLEACCSERRLLEALGSERVTKAMRKHLTDSYKEATGENIRLEADHVQELVSDLFLPEEL